jgi:NAD(P)-dependent dehydrogenase (short-subunit alcohol dehydrogenase family)
MLNATNANEHADKISVTPLRRLGEPIEVAHGVLFLTPTRHRSSPGSS